MHRGYFISARRDPTSPEGPAEAEVTISYLGDFDSPEIARFVLGRLLDESTDRNVEGPGGVQEKALLFDLSVLRAVEYVKPA